MMSDTATHRDPELTLTDLQGQVLNPAIEVYLPDTLSADQFRLLLPEPPSKPAFTFPALQNWLTNLLKNFDLQHNEQHPCHKHPFRLHEINVQAVDWFSSTKIGFMKIRAKIETDAYLHESDQAVRADWLPGAVFLRGGSVAMLVRPPLLSLLEPKLIKFPDISAARRRTR
jgi:ADP-sugar diphosphatase